MDMFWLFLRDMSYLLDAGGALALAGWILSRRRDRGLAEIAESVALALTACWALASLGLGPTAPAASAALSLAYLGWLWALYRLFAHDEGQRPACRQRQRRGFADRGRPAPGAPREQPAGKRQRRARAEQVDELHQQRPHRAHHRAPSGQSTTRSVWSRIRRSRKGV